MVTKEQLEILTKSELEELARKFDVELDRRLSKSVLIEEVLAIEGIEDYEIEAEGDQPTVEALPVVDYDAIRRRRYSAL